ncbi:hypothetical protein ACFSTC_20895 [Nonomuraea ferruginea]
MTISEQAAGCRQDYDGTSPFPEAKEHVPAGWVHIGLTAAIVVLPFVALAVAIFLAWGGRGSRSPICCWPRSCTC